MKELGDEVNSSSAAVTIVDGEIARLLLPSKAVQNHVRILPATRETKRR